MRTFYTALLLCCFAHSGFTHNLDVESYAEGNELVIQVWVGDEPAEGVEIEITNTDGVLRQDGVSNADGVFRWKPQTAETVTINVFAEVGHEKEFVVEKEVIRSIMVGIPPAVPADSQVESASPENGKVQVYSTGSRTDKNLRILVGVTFIFSIYAMYTAYRNRRKILELEKRLPKS